MLFCLWVMVVGCENICLGVFIVINMWNNGIYDIFNWSEIGVIEVYDEEVIMFEYDVVISSCFD